MWYENGYVDTHVSKKVLNFNFDKCSPKEMLATL